MWEKRKKAEIQMTHQNIDDENELHEIVNAEYAAAVRKHQSDIKMPGVIPMSAKYLN